MSKNNSNPSEVLAVITEIVGPEAVINAAKQALKSRPIPPPIKVTVSKGKDKTGKWHEFGFEAEYREDRIANMIVDAAMKCGYTFQELCNLKTERIGDYVYIMRDEDYQ